MRDCQPPQYDRPRNGGVDDQGRLPKNVTPTHYSVVFDPDVERGVYKGNVDIHLDVNEDTDSIVLHSVDLDVERAFVRDVCSCAFVDWPDVATNAETETIMLILNHPIPAQTQAVVSLAFSGSLDGKQSGFFRASFATKCGEKSWYAHTQMQPCDARRALPCFDEPALKATFDVTLIGALNHVMLSNMDVKSERQIRRGRHHHERRKVVQFQKSPPMSTYLLAFAIGDFHHIENNDFDVPIRVYTTRDLDVNNGKYAAGLSAKALAFYADKFGAEYPLPKLDLLGVRAHMGAMENWGLIIFQDSALIEENVPPNLQDRMPSSSIVLHEEAHLWFGDLVTCEWWQNIWLNESFASWVAWYALNHFEPGWQVWENFAVDTSLRAFGLDSLRSSHPIEVPLTNTGQINQVFDPISYEKGSGVLRMLSTFLQEDVFLQGVARYVQKHKYANTRSEDLWDALSKVSGEDVQSFMDPWVTKVGYPVVTVTEDNEAGVIYFRQNRFLLSGDVQPEEDTTIWPILLSLQTVTGSSKYLFKSRKGWLSMPSDDFYKINYDRTGFYRTLYPPDRLMKLAMSAQTGQLRATDQAGLVSDCAALSISGHQRTSQTLYFIKALLNDASFFVYKETIVLLTAIEQAWIFEDPNTTKALTAMTRDFVSPRAHKLGWDFDSDEADLVGNRFKVLLFTTAGMAGDETVVAAAKDMFARHMSGDTKALPHLLRDPVYQIAIKYGGQEQYDQLTREFRRSTNTSLREKALHALGCTQDPWLIQCSVELLFDPDVTSREFTPLLAGLATHRSGIQAVFVTLINRWDVLRARIASGIGGVGFLISSMMLGLATEAQAREVEAAFKERKQTGLDATLRQSLEKTRVKAAWVDRSHEDLEAWLKKEGYLQ